MADVHDERGAITAGGPRVTATIGQPGAISSFTFTATAGRSIYVDVSDASLADYCGTLKLVGHDRSVIRSGCIQNGTGELTHARATP